MTLYEIHAYMQGGLLLLLLFQFFYEGFVYQNIYICPGYVQFRKNA